VDLVVLDLTAPQINGLEVLRQIRSSGSPAWRGTPVIVTTHDEDIWEGWRSGADHRLPAPYHLDDLREVARGLCGSDDLEASEPG
jgi:DNA-binding response OmpR family regulator